MIAYRISDGKLATIATFDEKYFKTGAAAFMTIDEESSGVINVNDLLKPAGDSKSYFFFNAQVHTTLASSRPDLVLATADQVALNNAGIEGGQYYELVIDWTKVFS